MFKTDPSISLQKLLLPWFFPSRQIVLLYIYFLKLKLSQYLLVFSYSPHPVHYHVQSIVSPKQILNPSTIHLYHPSPTHQLFPRLLQQPSNLSPRLYLCSITTAIYPPNGSQSDFFFQENKQTRTSYHDLSRIIRMLPDLPSSSPH